jgi:dienelactone hydrolase
MDTADSGTYDPFAPGRFRVGVRTFEAHDAGRDRTFPAEVWYPADGFPAAGEASAEVRGATPAPGAHPLVVFSHFSFGGRRSATFLTRHLAGHGYVVAAVDHSELLAPELAPAPGAIPAQRAARIDAIIASRVPDLRFLLGYLLAGTAAGQLGGLAIDASRIGVAGHSFGGWSALALPEHERLVGAVVALAPGGSSHPAPGTLPLTLAFGWERAVPVLILAGDCDVPIPLEAVQDVYARAPQPRQMFVLRRADHEHFADDVVANHEKVRSMTFSGDAAWMPAAMLPAAELCGEEESHAFTRGLALAHLDTALRADPAAAAFLGRRAEDELRARAIDAYEYQPGEAGAVAPQASQ